MNARLFALALEVPLKGFYFGWIKCFWVLVVDGSMLFELVLKGLNALLVCFDNKFLIISLVLALPDIFLLTLVALLLGIVAYE